MLYFSRRPVSTAAQQRQGALCRTLYYGLYRRKAQWPSYNWNIPAAACRIGTFVGGIGRTPALLEYCGETAQVCWRVWRCDCRSSFMDPGKNGGRADISSLCGDLAVQSAG